MLWICVSQAAALYATHQTIFWNEGEFKQPSLCGRLGFRAGDQLLKKKSNILLGVLKPLGSEINLLIQLLNFFPRGRIRIRAESWTDSFHTNFKYWCFFKIFQIIHFTSWKHHPQCGPESKHSLQFTALPGLQFPAYKNQGNIIDQNTA